MSYPLQGIRVFELTHVISGSVAGMLLGDLGAEVVKIERPVVGEFYREEALKNENGVSIIFPSYNRNKKGITLNLKAPEAKNIIYKLILQYRVAEFLLKKIFCLIEYNFFSILILFLTETLNKYVYYLNNKMLIT